MFSLCFHDGFATGHWRRSGLTLQGPSGWIEVLDHPMVLGRAVIDGTRLGLQLLERPHPGEGGSASLTLTTSADESTWDFLRSQARDWPLHWFWLEADGRSLSIESSPLPTVPVYLTAAGGRARADWDPLRLLPFVRPRLNWEAAAYFLCTFDQPYSSATLVKDLQHLAGGYQARWRADQDQDGWRLVPPASAPPSYPRALRLEADPVRTFEGLLSAATERLVGSLGRVAAGLSGGLDSTLVCGTLARGGREVHSFGVLVPGEEREGQVRRRAAAVERCGLIDHVHSVGPEYSPWSGGEGRARHRGTLPWDELYYAPFEALYERAAAAGHQVFLTGLGGDDLLEPYWDELPERGQRERAELEGHVELPELLTPRVRSAHVERTAALNDLPRAFVQRSVLDSAAGMAAQTLRHGLWPIHPLITPEVVRYCHALPAELRQERGLMRDTLRRWGLPSFVSHPESTESFEGMCASAMRRCPAFARLMRAPRLADLGMVEPARVEEAFREWSARRLPSSAALPLVAIATLEATLESLESASRPVRPDVERV